MSYATIADMTRSATLLDRCTASVAEQATVTDDDASRAPVWVDQRTWDLAATPGWDDAWDSAVAAGIGDPGDNAGVITDGMILSRVQQLIARWPISPPAAPPVVTS